MATETTFSRILDKPMSQTERPKPLPAGSYRTIITERPRFDKSSKKQTDFVEFILHPLEAGEDVDEDDLNAVLIKADGSVGVLKDKSIRATFYLTEDAEWRLKKFLIDLGLEEDLSYNEAIDAALNREVIAYIKHVPSQDGSAVFAQLSGTAPVED